MGQINNNSLHEWWQGLVAFVGSHNPTQLHPHMIIFVLTCGAVLTCCWWVFNTYVRSPKTPGDEGGN